MDFFSFDNLSKTAFNVEGINEIGRLLASPPENFVGQEAIDALYSLAPGVPALITISYIVFVFGGQALMSLKSEGFNLKPIVTFWNFLLAIFSIMGAIVAVPSTFALLTDWIQAGFVEKLCTKPFYDGVDGYWFFLFTLSKVPELMDTVFLVLQKKPVIFLHWYHHFTVMLFVWYWGRASVFYATMNYAVHAIMYSYYFCMCFKAGRAVVKPIAPLITSLQILQMVFGLVVSVLCFVAYNRAQSHGVPCPGQDWLNIFLGTVMYLSYFILFCILFQKNYGRKNARKSKTK